MDGPTLRHEREQAGLTVEELADELDVTPAMVVKWEEGTARIPRRHVDVLPPLLARLREARSAPSRTRRRASKHPSHAVLLVPVLLLVAATVRYLPPSVGWELLVLGISWAVPALLAVNLYRGLASLRGAGALGRWLAGCAIGFAGMLGFMAPFVVSGYTGPLGFSGSGAFAAALLVSAVIGVLFSTFWTLSGGK